MLALLLIHNLAVRLKSLFKNLLLMNDGFPRESTMYNEQFVAIASTEIEAQIRPMPVHFTSSEFYERFAQEHSAKYEELILIYTARNHDRPHQSKL